MFVDGRSIPEGQSVQADVCIVGAGAAGIALARALQGRTLRVALVESGGFEPSAETQLLGQGSEVPAPYPPLETTRVRLFGGSTNHWSGRCGPLDASDFEERPWIPHSGWPFGPAELAPYYGPAAALCEVDDDDWDGTRAQSELGAPRLPVAEDVLTSIRYQVSPPTRFGSAYRADLERAPRVTVYLHSTVLELETDDEASTVEAVRVGCLPGNTYRVRARWFVLAAGGIENPRLLLLSHRAQPTGLGNAHDLVGRFFLEHPTAKPALWLPRDPAPDMRLYRPYPSAGPRGVSWLALSPEVARRERLAGYHVWPSAVRGWPRGAGGAADPLAPHVRNLAGDLDGPAGESGARPPGAVGGPMHFVLITSTELVPNPASRVVLSDERDRLGQPRVRLVVVPDETSRRTLERGTELVAAAITKAGLGRVKWIDGDPGERLRTGRAHHMGTTRMHVDPRRGVVDANGRVHGVSNLFVAGSSVFPTGGAGVPTLTLLALALRLAEHLRQLAQEEA